LNIEDCVILYIEDDDDIIMALKDYFVPKYNMEFVNSYDHVKKILKKLRPCLVIVDDDLNGTSRYIEIANDIKHIVVPTGKAVAYIGCTSLDVDMVGMKNNYKKQDYLDFILNRGTPVDLANMSKIIDKIIKNL